MLAEMKTEFDEAISEKRQEFETTREELKVYFLLSPTFEIPTFESSRCIQSSLTLESSGIIVALLPIELDISKGLA